MSMPLPKVGELIVRDGPNSSWVVHQPFEVLFSTNIKFVVPVGFSTDLLSSPMLIRCWLRQRADTEKAAVLHDFLYSTQLLSRSLSDHYFYLVLLTADITDIKAKSMWKAVTLWGRFPWKKYKKKLDIIGHKR